MFVGTGAQSLDQLIEQVLLFSELLQLAFQGKSATIVVRLVYDTLSVTPNTVVARNFSGALFTRSHVSCGTWDMKKERRRPSTFGLCKQCKLLICSSAVWVALHSVCAGSQEEQAPMIWRYLAPTLLLQLIQVGSEFRRPTRFMSEEIEPYSNKILRRRQNKSPRIASSERIYLLRDFSVSHSRAGLKILSVC
ncbi:hypothetical protein TMatcc_002300 [Talaromyces marneffei ATCC 18224]